jgi:hypothetical protein
VSAYADVYFLSSHPSYPILVPLQNNQRTLHPQSLQSKSETKASVIMLILDLGKTLVIMDRNMLNEKVKQFTEDGQVTHPKHVKTNTEHIKIL